MLLFEKRKRFFISILFSIKSDTISEPQEAVPLPSSIISKFFVLFTDLLIASKSTGDINEGQTISIKISSSTNKVQNRCFHGGSESRAWGAKEV